MRLKEIEERLAAIKNELTTRAAELKEEEITALENEVTALQEERAAIKAAAEKRSALLARIAAGESVGDGEGDGSGQQRVLRNFKGAAGEGDNDDKYGSMEYRKAFMKYVCRGEALPKEYRADAVSKSTDVGAVIPTTVLNQIVEKLESTGMILALVTRTAYKGGVSIPVSTVKPTATLLGRTVVLCDYVASYSAALAKDTIFAFLFNFKDYVLNTNYSMGVKKYEDNDTDDQITKGIMLVDGKVVDKNSLVVVKKIEAV